MFRLAGEKDSAGFCKTISPAPCPLVGGRSLPSMEAATLEQRLSVAPRSVPRRGGVQCPPRWRPRWPAGAQTLISFFSSEIWRQNEEIILALAVLGTLKPDRERCRKQGCGGAWTLSLPSVRAAGKQPVQTIAIADNVLGLSSLQPTPALRLSPAFAQSSLPASSLRCAYMSAWGEVIFMSLYQLHSVNGIRVGLLSRIGWPRILPLP